MHSDATGHWNVCIDCGYRMNFASHAANCETAGICAACGYEDASLKGQHISWLAGTLSGHYLRCIYCGIEMGEMEPHVNLVITYENEDCHTIACDLCGPLGYGHTSDCQNPGVCNVCGGAVKADLLPAHVYSDKTDFDGTHHWLVCDLCGAANEQKEEHVLEYGESTATCTQDGILPYSCSCGYTGSLEEKAFGHAWQIIENTAPTCTKAGRIVNECKNCGEASVEEIPAIGHD